MPEMHRVSKKSMERRGSFQERGLGSWVAVVVQGEETHGADTGGQVAKGNANWGIIKEKSLC